MKKQSNNDIRDSIIGLGENSIRKNYYPQFKNKINEVEELNKLLEKKVEIRTEELNKAVLQQKATNEKLQKTLDELTKTQKSLVYTEKMAALGELVAGVAHEINTPIGIGLTGITHFLQITEDINELYKNDDISKDEFEQYLSSSSEIANTININIIRAADLVKSFKQIAVDQTNEERRTFKVREYFNTIFSSIKNITKKANININIQCPSALTINSYPGIYSQVITNLIINSIMHGFKNRKDGNVNITVVEEDCIKVIYKDDGLGIQSDNLPKIFNPFFTTNRVGKGTGLGMSISYNIIEEHKGSIQVESEEGKGTTVHISLPFNIE